MNSAFVLTHAAAKDLEEILDYVAERGSPEAASRVEDRFHEELVRIGRHPSIGHFRRDLTFADVRFWPVWSYLVVYRAVVRPVEIVRIFHGARDLGRLLGDL